MTLASSPTVPSGAAPSTTPTVLACRPPHPKPLPAPTRPAFAATPRSPLSPKESRVYAIRLARETRPAYNPLPIGSRASAVPRAAAQATMRNQAMAKPAPRGTRSSRQTRQAPRRAMAATGKLCRRFARRDASTDTAGPCRLSNHWQWVIMIVVLVVGIAAIWIGACVWRRRYLRKKDSQMSLPQKHSGSAANPSWGPAIVGSESTTPMTCARDPEQSLPEKPKKKEKKAWTVGRRT